MKTFVIVLLAAILLALGTEAQKKKAKTRVIKKKAGLPRCAKNVTCEWGDSILSYRIDKAKRGKRRLYYVEKRTLAYDSGSVRFSLTPAYRKYFTRVSYSNEDFVRRFFLGARISDSKAPVVIDGKVTKRSEGVFKGAHDDPSRNTIDLPKHQEFNGEYTCSSRAEDVKKSICRIKVFLINYKVPYHTVAENEEKNCRCFERGIYEIRNYAEVEFKVDVQKLAKPGK